MACPGGTSQKVSLNASCQKKQENNWFMSRDLSCFQDTMPFYEVKEVGHVWAHLGDFLINIAGYIVSKDIWVYMV